jgi:hypothetical protein
MARLKKSYFVQNTDISGYPDPEPCTTEEMVRSAILNLPHSAPTSTPPGLQPPSTASSLNASQPTSSK